MNASQILKHRGETNGVKKQAETSHTEPKKAVGLSRNEKTQALPKDDGETDIFSSFSKPTPKAEKLKSTDKPCIEIIQGKASNNVRDDTTYTVLKYIGELPDYPCLAIDTETTGLERDAKLLGVSFCGEVGKAFWLPMENLNPTSLQEALTGKLLIMHNGKFDLPVLERNGVDLFQNPLFDTMIAHQLLDENDLHGLKYLAKKHLDVSVKHEQSPLIGGLLFDPTNPEFINYACATLPSRRHQIADFTFRLYELFEPQLKQEQLSRLFIYVEMPVVKVLAKMEKEGIRVDRKKLNLLTLELVEESKALSKEIYELSGEPFDINSTDQLSRILFDKLSLSSVKKTPKGKQSTDVESLEAIAGAHPVVPKILRFREIEKLLGTYLTKLPDLVDPTTGRIHCQIHQNGTVTGRFSSSSPNMQNIPRGDIIRSAFIPEKNHVFIDADFSQIELRCIAHYTQDDNMLKAYRSDADLHKQTAADMLRKPIEDVTPQERALAKTINFGLAYGMGANALAKRLDIPVDEASDMMNTYFRVYSKVKGYINRHRKEVERRGYVVNMFGRKRRLSGDYRKAFNALIQGTATDICKIAMVRLAEALPASVKMLLQVHDELLFEVPKDEAQKVLEQIVEVMEKPITGLDGREFSVPIRVDAKIANNWAEAK